MPRSDAHCAKIDGADFSEMPEPDLTGCEMATRTKKTPMSETHKEALAEGRNHARIVGHLDAGRGQQAQAGP